MKETVERDVVVIKSEMLDNCYFCICDEYVEKGVKKCRKCGARLDWEKVK